MTVVTTASSGSEALFRETQSDDYFAGETVEPRYPASSAELATTDLHQLVGRPRFRGGIDWLRNGILSGWAVDLTQMGEPVACAVAIGDFVLGVGETAIRRLDLESYVPNNIAGFRISLRRTDDTALSDLLDRLETASAETPGAPCSLIVSLADGGGWIRVGDFGITQADLLKQLRPSVDARAMAPRFELNEIATSDLEFRNWGPRFRGGVDVLQDGHLSGWAIDLTQPSKPLKLSFAAVGVEAGGNDDRDRPSRS